MKWTLVGLALGASVTVWVTAAVIYATWLRHEAHKMARRQEGDERTRLDRILQASTPPATPGLHRKRVS